MFFKPKRQHVVDSNGSIIKRNTSSVDQIIKPKRKKWLWFILLFILLIVGTGGYLGGNAWKALAKIVTKNANKSAPFLSFLGKIDPNKLQGEGDGRINILLLGIGGASHPGGQLTDTIIVASIDPVNKKMALLSIPRDLYVKIPGVGYNKINYAHAYGEQFLKNQGGGPALTKEVVSKILDIPIHYYIRMDFAGFINFVDELGGVDINVDKAVSDSLYPATNMVDYDPFYISIGQHHLNGSTALKYARSRETSSDFDRSRRQQQVMLAVKDKALSLGFLANPKKITEVFKIIGDHVRTDIQVWEMERIFSIAKDIDANGIVAKVLDNSSSGLLESGVIDGGYYLVPKAGVDNFGAIQNLAHEIFSDPYLKSENAKIDILNGTGQAGKATQVGDALKSYGYNVYRVEKTDVAETTVIYDYSQGANPFTTKFLADRFKVEIQHQPRPQAVSSDILIIVGKDYLKNMKSILSGSDNE